MEELKVKERILEFIRANSISVREFEAKSGLSNGYLRSLRNCPSVDKMKSIISAYPQLSKTWLLTGEGSMSQEEEEEEVRIPLLPISAIGGAMNDDDQGVMLYECEKVLSPVRNAQMAVRVSGDSMYPRYPNGSMVFVREVDASIFIEWGGYYVVNTTNGTIIKRVFKGEDNTIECRSVNPDYQPFNVPMGEVRKMYKILGSLHLE